jgi:hypothetical protein
MSPSTLTALIQKLENYISFDDYLKFHQFFSWFDLVSKSYYESNYNMFWRSLSNTFFVNNYHNEPWLKAEAFFHRRPDKTIQEFLKFKNNKEVSDLIVKVYLGSK